MHKLTNHLGPDATADYQSATASVEHAEAILEQVDAEESSLSRRHSQLTHQVIQLLLKRYPEHPPVWVRTAICQLSAADALIDEG